MARLASGRYVYKQDLGGLCSIYNDYGYEVFDSLIELVEKNITQKAQKVSCFQKKYYSITYIYQYISIFFNHCLLYAFSECIQPYNHIQGVVKSVINYLIFLIQ